MSFGTYRPDIKKDVEPGWAATEQYLENLFLKPDEALQVAHESHKTEDIPCINVPPLNGQLLFNLALARGTDKPLNILEIGTLAGYSTIWLAKAAKLSGGKVTTLEYESRHAEVARQNIERAGLLSHVELIVGDAHANLPMMVVEGRSYGMVFIDADKPGYCDYLEQALKMSTKGTLIIADNIIRAGKIADPNNREENVQGVRNFLEMAAKEPRLSTSAVQTVNEKGWDGFTVSVVL